MTFDIPHMIVTGLLVFGIIWLFDYAGAFDSMGKGRKTLLKLVGSVHRRGWSVTLGLARGLHRRGGLVDRERPLKPVDEDPIRCDDPTPGADLQCSIARRPSGFFDLVLHSACDREPAKALASTPKRKRRTRDSSAIIATAPGRRPGPAACSGFGRRGPRSAPMQRS